jgi:hypothetical protein
MRCDTSDVTVICKLVDDLTGLRTGIVAFQVDGTDTEKDINSISHGLQRTLASLQGSLDEIELTTKKIIEEEEEEVPFPTTVMDIASRLVKGIHKGDVKFPGVSVG